MLAHRKVIARSDQENAILDVLSDISKRRRKENDPAVTLVESSQVQNWARRVNSL